MTKKTVQVTKPTFREWYEKKFKKQLPLYLENAEKKARMAEYKREVNNELT